MVVGVKMQEERQKGNHQLARNSLLIEKGPKKVRLIQAKSSWHQKPTTSFDIGRLAFIGASSSLRFFSLFPGTGGTFPSELA